MQEHKSPEHSTPPFVKVFIADDAPSTRNMVGHKIVNQLGPQYRLEVNKYIDGVDLFEGYKQFLEEEENKNIPVLIVTDFDMATPQNAINKNLYNGATASNKIREHEEVNGIKRSIIIGHTADPSNIKEFEAANVSLAVLKDKTFESNFFIEALSHPKFKNYLNKESHQDLESRSRKTTPRPSSSGKNTPHNSRNNSLAVNPDLRLSFTALNLVDGGGKATPPTSSRIGETQPKSSRRPSDKKVSFATLNVNDKESSTPNRSRSNSLNINSAKGGVRITPPNSSRSNDTATEVRQRSYAATSASVVKPIKYPGYKQTTESSRNKTNRK